MKKILYALMALGMVSTYATAEWVNPPRKACTKNGGKLAPGGICESTWHDARRICNTSGARLPTINELRRVVTGCGGEIDDVNNNQNDPSYQSCYKRRGFSDANGYWSSTSYAGVASSAWNVYFDYGGGNWYSNSNSIYVRCVRDGQ